jgi:vWA domain found in the FtsH ternary systems/N-terminal helical region fused to the FtsH ternary system vWA domain
VLELRNATGEATDFICRCLWLQRVVKPTTDTVRNVLTWAMEMASEGYPLPPLGFIGDLGHAVTGLDRRNERRKDELVIHGFPPGLLRIYEDHVLGKIFADWTFERASDALSSYAEGREKSRGLAFLIDRIRAQTGFAGGVLLGPASIKTVLDMSPEEVLSRGWQLLSDPEDETTRFLATIYEELFAAVRRTPEIVAQEDLFELEKRTALADMGERVGLRQVLQAAAFVEAHLPQQPPQALSDYHGVHANLLDEDTYPVGGFSSLSNRGTMESLLHSQLAFMEPETKKKVEDRDIDLFDIKYLRDELLYYARDENQFLRRRRTFVFILNIDLAKARFKDANLTWQRGTYALALLVTIVRKLNDWLSNDALNFEFVFVEEDKQEQFVVDSAEKKKMPVSKLLDEWKTLCMILGEQLANGVVKLRRSTNLAEVVEYCNTASRRSICHCMLVGTKKTAIKGLDDDVFLSELTVSGPCPDFSPPKKTFTKNVEEAATTDNDPNVAWYEALILMLAVWL